MICYANLFHPEKGSMHPLWIINDIWQENRMELITLWYNAMFIRRRKHRKALSLWDGRDGEGRAAGVH